MYRTALIVSAALALFASASLCAATADPDIAASARSLATELKEPEFFQSRCLLVPILANDKVTVVSQEDGFHTYDRILAVNDEPVSATTYRALHEILIRHPPDIPVRVRVLRGGSDKNLKAHCLDSRSLYSPLRAAATAALADNATACAYWLADASKQHALGSTWRQLQLNCDVKAGRVTGPGLLAEQFAITHEVLLENSYSPDALRSQETTMQDTAEFLAKEGSQELAIRLRTQFAVAASRFSTSR